MNGIIDLGRLATDALFLAVDPYPRKPGVMFEPEVTAADPEDHPFAALKALQDEGRRANSWAFPVRIALRGCVSRLSGCFERSAIYLFDFNALIVNFRRRPRVAPNAKGWGQEVVSG